MGVLEIMYSIIEHDNQIILKLQTKLNKEKKIIILKDLKLCDITYHIFWTAVSPVIHEKVLITSVWEDYVTFSHPKFEGTALKTIIDINPGDWAWVLEHFPVNMEETGPDWIISKNKIEEPNLLFLNLEVLDFKLNLVKRLRIDIYTGIYKEI